MVLTFGDDQKGFKLQFATDEGKEICAKMRKPSARLLTTFLAGLRCVLTPAARCVAGAHGASAAHGGVAGRRDGGLRRRG